MGTPLQELTWQIQKLDDALVAAQAARDEIEHQAGEVKELDKDEIESLAQSAISELEGIDADLDNPEEIDTNIGMAINLLQDILKELDK